MHRLFLMMFVLAGCSTPLAPTTKTTGPELRTFVAACLAYHALSYTEAAPTPAGCEEGCRCGGTGVERSSDDQEDVACRCPETCPCKAKKAPVSTPGPTAPPAKQVQVSTGGVTVKCDCDVPAAPRAVIVEGSPGWPPKSTAR